MKKSIITGFSALLAVTCVMASNASAQNPFSIDGNVLDNNNSGVAATNPSPPCANPSPQACKVNDPFGSIKELGPINGNTTKVGVIHDDELPTLGMTTQPGQVDLRAVWLQTATATDGDIWFYFGFYRDSNTGSGFNAVEMQQSGVPTGCVYTGVNPADDASAIALAGCNPWANRQEGDFMIIFDAQGNDLTIYKRVFTGNPLVLGPLEAVPSGSTQFSADGFRGEAAVNLTEDLFPADGSCVNIANIIPNTVTGNSDTADYKDTVLAHFAPITNCGTLIVNKVTDVAESGSFAYTVNRVSGDPLRFAGDGGQTQLSGTLYRDTAPDPDDVDLTDTHIKLIAATDYRIGETVPTGWTFLKVVCSIDGGTETTYNANPAYSITVQSGKTTTCTIHNTLNKASPEAATQPLATVYLRDGMSITGIRRGPTETSMSVLFRLYDSLASCQADSNRTETVGTGGLLLSETVSISLLAGETSTTVTTVTPGKLLSNLNNTYYWWAKFSGNTLNNAAEKGCGIESTAVVITHTASGGS